MIGTTTDYKKGDSLLKDECGPLIEIPFELPVIGIIGEKTGPEPSVE